MATLPIEGWDALYRATDQPKNMILSFSDGTTLRNPQIVLEQMSLEESLCSEENLRFGCCESSCFQIRVVNNEQSFEGLYLNVVQAFPPQLVRLIGSDDNYIVDDQGDYISGADIFYAQYGNFLVVSDKPTGDRQYRDLTCYDKMYEIIHANVFEWYDGLTFPISVKDFRDSFFEYLNVAQVETDLINDDFMIQGEFYVSEELSGRMVIESICELNGAFGHINRDGLFEYITLPTEDSLTYPHYVNGTCAYEDYETEAITGIRAINVEGDSGTVVGTEVNPYIMQSNILTFGSEGSEELMDALNNMLDLVSQFTYTPFKVTTYGNPMLPLGTNVTFETRYKTINSFVMTRYLSGLQALRDTFTTLGDRMYPQDVNRIKNEIQRSGGLTHKLTNDVNTLDSEIFDEHGNSRISQTLDEIVLKVNTSGKLVQAKLSQDASQGSTFTIVADTFILNSNNFKVTASGNITATSGTIGGITIENNCLSGETESGTSSNNHIYRMEINKNHFYTDDKHHLVNYYPDSYSTLDSTESITVDANYIKFGYFQHYVDKDYEGEIINENTEDYEYQWYVDNYGVRLEAYDILHKSGNSIPNWGSDGITVGFNPYLDGAFREIYNKLYNPCDKRLKHNIKAIDDKLVNAIGKCKTYQFNINNRDKQGLYLGIMAQDLISACEKEGIKAEDYKIIQKDLFVPKDDTEYYLVDYPQLALLQIQYLKKQIDELKEIINKQ